MPKDKKKTTTVVPEGPRCPICGRRSAVRRLDARTHYCNHCGQAFSA